MTTRRDFLKISALATSGMSIIPSLSFAKAHNFTSRRPDIKDRTFTSKAIEDVILEVKDKLKDKQLAWLFENCFPNTLDTTVFFKDNKGRPETHIITGDIDAMWLRDSTCQVWPYIPFANRDEKISINFLPNP